MRLVTASAKNHSRIRPSDSASAITTARAERLGALGHEKKTPIEIIRSSRASIPRGARHWRMITLAYLYSWSRQDPNHDRSSDKAAFLPLGHLKKEIMKITAGRKIAYVVDCSFTNANIEKIARLAKDADILFIEATFLEAMHGRRERSRGWPG